jgi:L-asparaginase
MDRVCLITTGGTIEKTYDEESGELSNRRSIVRRMLRDLRLEDLEVEIVELMSKDSLYMDDADRDRVAAAVGAAFEASDREADDAARLTGVVILHGTDTLTRTGERILESFPEPRVPVVLTGAMRPFEMKRSDALQNLTEALFASRALPPGVYVVAHGRALALPGVKKDRERGTFLAEPGSP